MRALAATLLLLTGPGVAAAQSADSLFAAGRLALARAAYEVRLRAVLAPRRPLRDDHG